MYHSSRQTDSKCAEPPIFSCAKPHRPRPGVPGRQARSQQRPSTTRLPKSTHRIHPHLSQDRPRKPRNPKDQHPRPDQTQDRTAPSPRPKTMLMRRRPTERTYDRTPSDERRSLLSSPPPLFVFSSSLPANCPNIAVLCIGPACRHTYHQSLSTPPTSFLGSTALSHLTPPASQLAS